VTPLLEEGGSNFASDRVAVGTTHGNCSVVGRYVQYATLGAPLCVQYSIKVSKIIIEQTTVCVLHPHQPTLHYVLSIAVDADPTSGGVHCPKNPADQQVSSRRTL